ncbi:MAG TPA: hypothetical protein VNA25_13615, partial [Phycisphaerae bacterium]|nr:hypothetical protein [Phycisphaerae bacterium]
EAFVGLITVRVLTAVFGLAAVRGLEAFVGLITVRVLTAVFGLAAVVGFVPGRRLTGRPVTVVEVVCFGVELRLLVLLTILHPLTRNMPFLIGLLWRSGGNVHDAAGIANTQRTNHPSPRLAGYDGDLCEGVR